MPIGGGPSVKHVLKWFKRNKIFFWEGVQQIGYDDHDEADSCWDDHRDNH